MRVDLARVVDPARQQGKDRGGIGQQRNTGIVLLQGSDERFGHAVRLWASDQREEQRQAESCGRLAGDVGAAIVREPFEPMRGSGAAEAAFDGCHHEVANHLAGDACISDGRPGDDFAIAGIDDEEDTHHFAAAGVNLKVVRAPSEVRAESRDDAIMGSARPPGGMTLERQVMACMIRSTRLALITGFLPPEADGSGER